MSVSPATPATATVRQVSVAEADAGERLDRFLARHLAPLSRSRVKSLIKAGHARLDGRTIVEPNRRVKPGERWEIVIPPPEPAIPRAEAIPLRIVHEDEDIIVVDKPPGLVVHPAAGNWTGTLVNALIHHCGDSLSGVGGVRRPGIVHRLDKDTSGLLVVAKHDVAHQALVAQFADHGRHGPLARRYQALVWGVPSPPAGRIDLPLGRKVTNRQKMAVVSEGGKVAITHYQVAEAFGPEDAPEASLVTCRLETGRTHQIRVHMAHLGHPLIGDALYGAHYRTKARRLPSPLADHVRRFSRQALHASHLAFAHPRTGERLAFDSPFPPDMANLLAQFRQAW